MSELEVNMTQMTVDAGGFSDISTLSGEIGSYLRNSLSLLGDFWGNDTVGHEFVAQWNPAISGLLDTLSGIGDGMKGTADGVINSANLYRKSNEVNSELAG
jgi:uncharacterized protein YukE